MSDSNVTQLPVRVDFDLDAIQRDAAEVKQPFAVKIGERVVEMKDPSDLDWKDLILLDSPTELLRLCLSKDDRDYLVKQSLPGWKFNKLMEAFNFHYDLEDKIREARNQQRLAGL